MFDSNFKFGIRVLYEILYKIFKAVLSFDIRFQNRKKTPEIFVYLFL
jgi:hypothetical protein